MDKERAIEKLNDIRCHVKETSAEEQALVMAIEAFKAQLSQEGTTSDLISRQAAIDALWKALYEYEDKTAKKFQESEDLDIQDWIEHRIFVQNMNDIDRQTILNLPPAQPEPKWIPVERELPEDYTDVLVWFEYFRYGDYNCLYQTHGIGAYVAEYNSWMINHESGWKDLRVIAWMSLPEPYKPNK